jgi:hypothetical protein
VVAHGFPDRNPEDCQYFDETMPGTHQGPMIYYLAKVDDAATTKTTGLDWFKIGQDGLDLSTGMPAKLIRVLAI